MSKLIKLGWCFILSILCFACSQAQNEEAPQKVVKYFLDAYQKQDQVKLQTFSQWKDFTFDALKMQEGDFIEGVDNALQQEVYKMGHEFNYEIGQKAVDKKRKKAEVVVTLFLYDFQAASNQGLEAMKVQSSQMASSNVDDASATIANTTIFFQALKKAKLEKEYTLKIQLVNDDGWVVAKNNEDFQKILADNIKNIQIDSIH